MNLPLREWWAPPLPTRCWACRARIWPWSRHSCETATGHWVCSGRCWGEYADFMDGINEWGRVVMGDLEEDR